jgi:hypothetical protein
MGKTEAKAKLQKELAAYRKATGELSGYNCYQRAPEIMFTEAAADRINWLLDDADMCALIEAGGTLKGCVASIITYCKQDIGQAGEITEDDFRACIKDYYRLPEPKALAPMEKKPVPLKSRSSKTPEETKPDPKPELSSKIGSKSGSKSGPTMLSTQLDLFGMMEAKA